MAVPFAERQVPSPRHQSTARLGALAGIAPSLTFVAWISIARWNGTTGEFLLSLTTISVAAVVAGRIVGSRLGGSVRSSLLGVVAYSGVAWLIFVPLGVIGSTWQRVQDGSITDPAAVVVVVAGLLAYALVSSIWVPIYLMPFGAIWMVTFRLLGRALAP